MNTKRLGVTAITSGILALGLGAAATNAGATEYQATTGTTTTSVPDDITAAPESGLHLYLRAR